MDPLQSRYEALPYGGQAYRATHPDRIAAVARLAGLREPPVETARVLEIGCGDGFNLVAMADSLPEATFVGVDLSEDIIAPGRAMAEAAGIPNVTFVAGALPTLPDLGAPFDYVIAHGVYSWLPPDVFDGALTGMARVLSPNGLVYVSYNAYPGWHLRNLARDLMRLETDADRPADEQVDRAQALLAYVGQELGEDGHHALVLQYAARQLEGRSSTYLFHDYLAPWNTPLLFTDFVARAGEAELAYVGECKGGAAALGAMSLPETLQSLLAVEPDWLRREQLLDHLRNTGFRRSVLCAKDRAPNHEFDASHAIETLRIGLRGYATAPFDLAPDEPAEFAAAGGEIQLTVSSPAVKATLEALAERHPEPLTWVEILAEVGLRLPDAWRDTEDLASNLAQLFALEVVDLLPRPVSVARTVAERPVALAFARWQATAGADSVVNAFHEHVELPPVQRQILLRCDGTHTHAALVEAIVGDIADGTLSLHLDGDSVADPALVREAVELAVPQELERLAWIGLLRTH